MGKANSGRRAKRDARVTRDFFRDDSRGKKTTPGNDFADESTFIPEDFPPCGIMGNFVSHLLGCKSRAVPASADLLTTAGPAESGASDAVHLGTPDGDRDLDRTGLLGEEGTTWKTCPPGMQSTSADPSFADQEDADTGNSHPNISSEDHPSVPHPGRKTNNSTSHSSRSSTSKGAEYIPTPTRAQDITVKHDSASSQHDSAPVSSHRSTAEDITSLAQLPSKAAGAATDRPIPSIHPAYDLLTTATELVALRSVAMNVGGHDFTQAQYEAAARVAANGLGITLEELEVQLKDMSPEVQTSLMKASFNAVRSAAQHAREILEDNSAKKGLPVPRTRKQSRSALFPDDLVVARSRKRPSKPPLQLPAKWSELTPTPCTCPKDCNRRCWQCELLQMNGFKEPETRKKVSDHKNEASGPSNGDTRGNANRRGNVHAPQKSSGKANGKAKAAEMMNGTTFKYRLWTNYRDVINLFSSLTNAWTFTTSKQLTKGHIRQFASYLKFTYPPRRIDTTDTHCDCEKCKIDEELAEINKKIRGYKAFGVVDGHAITFSKDIVEWVNLMETVVGHTWMKKMRPFVATHSATGGKEWERIWFHSQKGDLDKLYENMAFTLLRGLMRRPNPGPMQLDKQFVNLTKQAVAGLFVDMYRTLDGLKRRKRPLKHWDLKGKANIEKLVDEMDGDEVEVSWGERKKN